MTTTLKQQEGGQPEKPCFDNDYLTHFLSPIALAASKANYQPFTYTFGNYKLRIGSETAQDLLKIDNKQQSIYTELLLQIRNILIETDGAHAEFLSTPIADVGLNTRTYHGLNGSGDCKTMLDVAKLGSYKVSRLRLLGPKSVKEVRNLFVKAGCVELFDTERHE